MDKFWNFKKVSDEEEELRIDGVIVDCEDAFMYELFGYKTTTPNAFRDALEARKDKAVTCWINSIGGSVFAAIGISSAIEKHGNVTMNIECAISAASVVACAGKAVNIVPTGIIMMHNPLSSAEGYASDLRKTADVLDIVKESLVNAYVKKTGKPRDEISKMMDEETYMSAGAALKNSFVDSILYADEKQTAVMNFSYNRLAVMNVCLDGMTKAIEMYAEEATDNGGVSQPVTDTEPDALAEQRKKMYNIRKKINGGTL